MIEDEMVEWHHLLNGHEFAQALRDGERQGSLVCFSPGVEKSQISPNSSGHSTNEPHLKL